MAKISVVFLCECFGSVRVGRPSGVAAFRHAQPGLFDRKCRPASPLPVKVFFTKNITSESQVTSGGGEVEGDAHPSSFFSATLMLEANANLKAKNARLMFCFTQKSEL